MKLANIFVGIAGQLARSFVIVVNVGPNPVEDVSILQALTTGEFFSELGQVSVACRKTSSQPTGVCEQYTHKYITYRVTQHNHISSREHEWLKIKDCTSLCPQNNCHPLVMSLSLPHLTLTTSTSSLSPFSIHFSFLSDGLTFTNKHYESQPTFLPCDGPRQSGGSTQIPSQTHHEELLRNTRR